MTRAESIRSTHVVAVAVALTLTACADDDGTAAASTTATPPVTTTVPTTTIASAPATTTSTPALTPLEEEALDRIATYFVAVNAGDLDAIEAVLGKPFSVADRRSWEFHALLKEAGTEWRVGECEITGSADWFVNVECDMVNTNPVFAAVGASQAIAPFALIEDELRAHQWQAVETDFTFALNAQVRYLQMVDPEGYALCDPAAQTEEFTEHAGIARVPECAEVLIEHRDDIVAWIEAGEPDL